MEFGACFFTGSVSTVGTVDTDRASPFFCGLEFLRHREELLDECTSRCDLVSICWGLLVVSPWVIEIGRASGLQLRRGNLRA